MILFDRNFYLRAQAEFVQAVMEVLRARAAFAIEQQEAIAFMDKEIMQEFSLRR